MTYRKNTEHMASRGLSMTSGTIAAILLTVCSGLIGPAQEIMKSITKADIIHIDETSIKLAGITIWIFYNLVTGDTLFLLRLSRGRDVVREVLGGQLERSDNMRRPECIRLIQDTSMLDASDSRPPRHSRQESRRSQRAKGVQEIAMDIPRGKSRHVKGQEARAAQKNRCGT